MMNLSELKERLREGVVDITFTKKDGSERQGFFTTKASLVAETSGTGSNKKGPDLLVVTEILEEGDAQWRSFHFDQIKTVGV